MLDEFDDFLAMDVVWSELFGGENSACMSEGEGVCAREEGGVNDRNIRLEEVRESERKTLIQE